MGRASRQVGWLLLLFPPDLFRNPLLDAQSQPGRPASLTADAATSLGNRTPAQLAAALRTGQSPHGPVRYPMPKCLTMTDEEVRGLHAYLQSVPKLQRAVAAAP